MSSPLPLKQRLVPMLDELEEACAQAEAAMRARDWKRMRETLFDQRRIKQAIINELAATSTTIETLPEIFSRLQAIFAFRSDQLRRLVSYRNEVSTRLQNARKWKDAARAARKALGPNAVVLSRTQ